MTELENIVIEGGHVQFNPPLRPGETVDQRLGELQRQMEASRPKSAWQPIETAPLDGTVVDLWMIDENGRQWREADAYYVVDYPAERPVWDADKGSFRHYGEPYKRSGWYAPNHDYDGASGWCDEPEYFCPPQNKTVFTRATHWMHQPEPPTT